MPTLIHNEYIRFWDNKGNPKEGTVKDGEGWKHLGKTIMGIDAGRSIWFRPFTGGGGEVRTVTHLYLEGDPVPKIQLGTPIYEDELIETG